MERGKFYRGERAAELDQPSEFATRVAREREDVRIMNLGQMLEDQAFRKIGGRMGDRFRAVQSGAPNLANIEFHDPDPIGTKMRQERQKLDEERAVRANLDWYEEYTRRNGHPPNLGHSFCSLNYDPKIEFDDSEPIPEW